MALGRHRRGHVIQPLEVGDPEIFVDVDVARARLGAVGVGGAKVQLGAVAEDDGVAVGEGDPEEGAGNLADIGLEHLGLRLGGGQEYLVAALQDGILERLAGKVVGHADLARLQDIAGTRQRRIVFGLAHPQLVAEQGIEPGQEVLGRQLTDVVLAAGLAPLAAVVQVTTATLAPLGCRFGPLCLAGLEGMLPLGQLERLFLEADMVADEAVELLLLPLGFLLPMQQCLHPAGDGILDRFVGQ
ncbi:hypothetical protein D3C73_952210 [compost metagenome]